ncbi:HD domain-containing phosphohydrolase [Planctobacterium marinum]|uniref:HD domain-containing phosphohydrolase n=1 Tax=Planctobacterium marinum TaxID=1631968 RepID=UPI001E5B785A|nr:HD domain-containing phosphohydrolase [Planctobacterium marinum]MCC2606852.1 Hpt domain-containing protein [Planctobacterium marinum]
MQTFTHDDLDAEILGDLLEEINELYEASEQTLIELELKPKDNELQRALFRSIHTIKGDLGMVNFSPLIPLLQHVEDLLDFLRNGQINYTSTMSDLVLLTLDRVKLFVESCISSGTAQYDDQLFKHLVQHISRIKPDNGPHHEKLLAESVLLLDPTLDAKPENDPPAEIAQSVNEDLDTDDDSAINKESNPLDSDSTIKVLSKERQTDIVFFRALMEPIEARSMYWAGRGDRIAKLALLMNKMEGSPIDADQLLVACYVHDFGMAFMPLHILHKRDRLEIVEFNLLRSHVYKSSRLLEHLDQWNEARKIVMQHHERCDGSGYPLGLMEKDICEGAKLLAILDTFDALTHQRAHDTHRKRPKKRAVIEMNNMPEGQYSQRWMAVFNKAMASLLMK